MDATTSALHTSPGFLTRALHHHLSTADVVRSPKHVPSPQPSSINLELTDFSRSRSSVGRSPSFRSSVLPAPSTSADTKAHQPENARLNQIVMYCVLFLNGWNDATAGPLLPTIQAFYHVDFTIVSMLFVCATLGYGVGAILNIPISDKFGLGRIIFYCGIVEVFAYAAIVPALPFPVMCSCYSVLGCALALQNAQGNVYTSQAGASGTTAAMGLLHGFYGFGALAAPLLATQFARREHWAFFYLISMSIALFNTVLSFTVIRFKRIEDLLPHDMSEEAPLVKESKFKHIFGRGLVYLLAFYLMVYVGAEVTTGGWIVTFLEQTRGGGNSAGYVSTGFFGGITLGRFILWPVTDFIGKDKAIYLYTLIAVGFEMVVWFVPHLITNAIAVSIVGVALGPLYPIVMAVSADSLPKWILIGSIGFISSVGQMGSAVFPFLTGVMATKYGVSVLQPFIIGMFGLMLVLWTILSYTRRKRDD